MLRADLHIFEIQMFLSLFFCLLFHLSTLALLACLLAGCMGKVHRNSVFFVAAGFLLQRPFLSLSSPSPKKKECSDEKYKFHIYFWFSN